MKIYKALLIISLILNVSCKHKIEENKTQAVVVDINKTERLEGEALLDSVQRQTIKYFWDFAEPNSGNGEREISS